MEITWNFDETISLWRNAQLITATHGFTNLKILRHVFILFSRLNQNSLLWLNLQKNVTQTEYSLGYDHLGL